MSTHYWSLAVRHRHFPPLTEAFTELQESYHQEASRTSVEDMEDPYSYLSYDNTQPRYCFKNLSWVKSESERFPEALAETPHLLLEPNLPMLGTCSSAYSNCFWEKVFCKNCICIVDKWKVVCIFSNLVEAEGNYCFTKKGSTVWRAGINWNVNMGLLLSKLLVAVDP